MNFKSDNVAPTNPEIIEAITKANQGFQSSYGADDYSLILQKKLSEVFEKEVIIFLTNTGTAANCLALSSLTKSYEAIYCHNKAHINTDECGAPEFFTGGAKLVTLEGVNGKINPDSLSKKILHSFSSRPHEQKPGCISITQATECGTIYTVQELTEIHKIAMEHNLPIHMDGARFANSLVALNCSPADITWKTGIDVLSFGATKNGAICAEAIVFFNHKYAENFDYTLKRSGQLTSKSRFFSCQFLAYLHQDLWLKNAAHANFMAKQLAQVFLKHNIEIIYPVESNELFVKFSSKCATYLRQNNCGFYEWGAPEEKLYRFVTSFFTSIANITELDACLSMLNTHKF
jgi:threonine aldolase